MKGIVMAEELHIVNILPAIDITGGVTADIFTMANHAHATIILTIGVSAAAFTKILINECTDFAGTGATAIPFAIYKEETAAGDTLGPRVAEVAAGTTPSANDTIMYCIELDASELSDASQFVELELTNGANSVIAAAIAILSGPRYAKVESATQIV